MILIEYPVGGILRRQLTRPAVNLTRASFLESVCYIPHKEENCLQFQLLLNHQAFSVKTKIRLLPFSSFLETLPGAFFLLSGWKSMIRGCQVISTSVAARYHYRLTSVEGF